MHTHRHYLSPATPLRRLIVGVGGLALVGSILAGCGSGGNAATTTVATTTASTAVTTAPTTAAPTVAAPTTSTSASSTSPSTAAPSSTAPTASSAPDSDAVAPESDADDEADVPDDPNATYETDPPVTTNPPAPKDIQPTLWVSKDGLVQMQVDPAWTQSEDVGATDILVVQGEWFAGIEVNGVQPIVTVFTEDAGNVTSAAGYRETLVSQLGGAENLQIDSIAGANGQDLLQYQYTATEGDEIPIRAMGIVNVKNGTVATAEFLANEADYNVRSDQVKSLLVTLEIK